MATRFNEFILFSERDKIMLDILLGHYIRACEEVLANPFAIKYHEEISSLILRYKNAKMYELTGVSVETIEDIESEIDCLIQLVVKTLY